jgi:uncharacterized protein YeaO (DUF488 family)
MRRNAVDRLWPRDVSKQEAKIDLWVKQIAPSAELHNWFNHDPKKWDEFRRRYYQELDRHLDIVKQLADLVNKQRETLAYGAKNQEFNQAMAPKEYFEKSHKSRPYVQS